MTVTKTVHEIDCTRLAGRFTDVVFLTHKPNLPIDIRCALHERGLSFSVVPFDRYDFLYKHEQMIGTAIIDTEGLNTKQQHQLPRIIESLEMRSIDVALFAPHGGSGKKGFLPAASRARATTAPPTELRTLGDFLNCVGAGDKHPKRRAHAEGSAPEPDGEECESNVHGVLAPAHPAQESVNELRKELCMASSVQRDFLPSRLPDCQHVSWASLYLPAQWVSGDIFGAAWVDQEHIGFYVADAVGHAMPAALLAIFLKQALVMREIIEYNYRIFSPVEVIENLNRTMCRETLSGYRFATCCYCLLNVDRLELTVARGGHPYPLLIRPGEPPQQLQVRGSLLGIFETAEFRQKTVSLKSGDRVLIYSDGAEPFIGHLEDQSGFVAQPDFLGLLGADIGDIITDLNDMVKHRNISPAETDDITILGLQIH